MLLAFSVFLICGCSGDNNPAMPTGTDSTGQTGTIENSGLTEIQSESAQADRILWGYWTVHVDPVKQSYEIVPLRQAANHWNILKWLEQEPCANCFKIVHAEPSGTGTLLVDIRVKHPFPSALLTGFDVRGIAIFNGTHLFPSANVMTSSDSEGAVVNADGYTSLYNPGTEGSGPGGLQGYIKGKYATATPPSSSLNPFKRFISNDLANTRNAFYAGEAIIVEYEVRMPGKPFVFGYAVDANWVPATNKPVTEPMTDFPPEANCPESWNIDVTVVPVGNGLNDNGGWAKIDIDVYDWQGSGSYSVPTVECPELFDGAVEATWKADETDHTTFEAVITNTKKAPIGNYMGLIKVEDKANDSAPDWLDLSAYQIVSLDVAEFVNDLPIALAVADPNPQMVCEPVDFDDNGSYDPDGGPIMKYEWDWDNDGIFDEVGNHVFHIWDIP
ncbi:MAG: hypothetical protein ABIC40_00225, partial [bacterium]